MRDRFGTHIFQSSAGKNRDLHFLPNCVLLDVPAFDINTKCPRAWFKKGIHAIITRPTTRANTMSRLYVISAAESYVSSETVTEHYTSFLKMILGKEIRMKI